jgi:sugar-specific transcriptional regulator TrmB
MGTSATEAESIDEAVYTLQQLGLKRYEAACFVALSRLGTASAKQVAESTDVPRTRVYESIHVLEEQGLVEVHHTNPKRFRPVCLDEATHLLRNQYHDRIDRLRRRLESLEPVEPEQPSPES